MKENLGRIYKYGLQKVKYHKIVLAVGSEGDCREHQLRLKNNHKMWFGKKKKT